ncbi:MAG: hypothetical protein HY650_02900 [Acidobacteria bacterium]|nr:hypothetical protein [Acidobacteriota bacterium]
MALFFTDHAADLTPSPGFPLATSISGDEPEVSVSDETDRRGKIRAYLSAHGACFFSAIHEAAGSGYPGDTLAPLWELVWTGEVTNDTLMPLRSLTTPRQERRKHHTGRPFLSRRQVPPTGEGRWSLLSSLVGRIGSPTERAAARTKQLLERYGILTREAMATDSSPGGFAALYTVLRALEERGRIRRGYFVEGLGAMQFALPEAIDRLRRRREPPVRDEVVMLAATDPANLYGSVLGWPVVASSEVDGEDAGRRGPTRSAGCQVILINGDLAAFIGRGEPQFFVFIPEDEPARSRFAHGIADALVAGVRNGTRRGLFISMVNGVPATESELAPALLEAGFIAGPRGFMLRRSPLPGHDGQVAGEFRPGILS